jgi:UDP-GlcNAc:undecaprenyl-phosphate GlcNAc-1-phosphate transferase
MFFPFNVYLGSLVGAAVVAALSMPLWRRWCERTGTMDDPGHRKIHSRPIPLAGGLAVMTGIAVPLLFGAGVVAFQDAAWMPGFLKFGQSNLIHYGFTRRSVELLGILVGAIGMLLVGLWDDRVELSPAIKFGGQLLIAMLVVGCGVRITLFVHNVVFSWAVSVLWILTVVNAFNFMDNMNGLCSGLGVIGALFFAFLAAIQGDYLVAAVAFLIAGALMGFLPSNFPKARAFLGDAGSHLVGFLMAVLAILPHFYSSKHPHPFAVLSPLLVLAVPLLDLVSVVIIRWRLGKPFYVGDNNHLSHRLVRAGCSQTRAVLIIWALAVGLGGLAFL